MNGTRDLDIMAALSLIAAVASLALLGHAVFILETSVAP